MKTASKPLRKPSPKAVKAVKVVAASSLSAVALSSRELHASMLDYATKVSASKKSARAFLKRIGAPLKDAA